MFLRLQLNYVQDKVFVGLDFAPPDYNIKEKLEGQNVSYGYKLS